MVSSYIAFFSQSFNHFSISIIPWSCLSISFSSPVSLRFSGYCCAAVISVTWCTSPWSSAVIISVTCQLLTWSSIVKFQITYCLSIWSSSTWIFLIIYHLSAWSFVTWSWFKAENVNRIFLSISSHPLRRSKNFDFFIFKSCRRNRPFQSPLIFK